MGVDPSVTVLVPARDEAPFVEASLKSVLSQTYGDLEVVVVDDGSVDGTVEILASVDDGRVRVLRLERSSGISAALNAGLSISRGRYVARMDADDVALPDRVERQLAVLERDPSIGIVGGNLEPIDADGRPAGSATNVPTSPGHVRWMLHTHNCVNHPTVVADREVLVRLGGYRSEAEPAEDYDLWVRAIDVTQIANVPDVVVQYRVHDDSTSTTNATDATRSADAIAASALTRLLGAAPDLEAVRVLRDVERSSGTSPERLRAASSLLWRYTRAILADPTLTDDDRAAIRRDAVAWFGALVRSVAGRDPRVAATLVVPRHDGPPLWALGRGAALAGRRAVRLARR